MTDQVAANAEESTAPEINEDVNQEQVATDANTEESAPQTTGDAPAEPKKDDGVQKRINKITADKWAEKRRADALEKRLKDLESNATQPQQTTEPVMPNEADYDFDDPKYKADLAQYHRDVATHAASLVLAEHDNKTANNEEETRLNNIFNTFDQKVAESGIENFYAVTANLPEFDPSVRNAMMEVDNAPNVVHYLSEHMDVADIIANASPVVAAIKIGEISTRLANTKTANISNAPDPIEPINQGGAATGEREDPLIAGATFE